jgi:hypothetical protein
MIAGAITAERSTERDEGLLQEHRPEGKQEMVHVACDFIRSALSQKQRMHTRIDSNCPQIFASDRKINSHVTRVLCQCSIPQADNRHCILFGASPPGFLIQHCPRQESAQG